MGRRRGPTPSLLPPPAPAAESIDYHEVRRIMLATCWAKNAYGSLYVARHVAVAAAKRGDVVSAYQCPFHTLHDERHWHVGHAPNQHHVERLALAIRWCSAHPDEVPTPPPG